MNFFILLRFKSILIEKVKIEEQVKKIVGKIAESRLKRGYTFENMADELSITPAAYRKIETGIVKVSVASILSCGNRHGLFDVLFP